MTQIRWGGKWVHLAYIWIVCHLSAKNYQNRWKFDAVLTKTNLLSFFETRCSIPYLLQGAPQVQWTRREGTLLMSIKHLAGVSHFRFRLLAINSRSLSPGWTGSYTCSALRLYQLAPMRVPECNQKVTGSCHKAVTAVKPWIDGCKAVSRRL